MRMAKGKVSQGFPREKLPRYGRTGGALFFSGRYKGAPFWYGRTFRGHFGLCRAYFLSNHLQR